MARIRHSMVSRFARDERGSVFIFVGLAIIVLLGVVAIALDLGMQGMLKTRMQNAADSAALAGALADGASNGQREAVARRFFALNYPDQYMDTDLTAANVGITASGTSVLVDTHVRQRKAELLPVLGRQTIETQAVSEVQNSGSSQTAIRDVTLVMDASGSMQYQVDETTHSGGVRIEGARSAARSLVNELLCKAPSVGSRIGWVEYASTCRSAYDCTDSSISMPLNGSCGTVTSKVNSYRYQDQWNNEFSEGWTNGGDGMERAESLMSAARPNVVRAVVYMTDGLNNSYKSRNWCFDMQEAQVNQCHGAHLEGARQADAPTAAACSRLKANGILVYGVAFSADAQDAEVIRNCASGPEYYFYAANTTELLAAFETITTSIKKIRITR